jgi:hypothetical protein
MKKNKTILKSYFETGDKPTQSQYEDLIDSLRHVDDNLPASDVENLENHFNDTSIHTTSTEKAKWNNHLSEYSTGEILSPEMGAIMRIFNGSLYVYQGAFEGVNSTFTCSDFNLEIAETPSRWKLVLSGAHTPEITLVTPLIVQRSALLTMAVKAKFLDSTSKVIIENVSNATETLDLANDTITITFNSPDALGMHDITVTNKAGAVKNTQQLSVADDLEITPITADWVKEGAYASELTINDNVLFPNVEIFRNPGERAAVLQKEILGNNFIPAGQNFELHMDNFIPTGYTLSPNNDLGVKEVASTINAVSTANSYVLRGGGNDSTQFYANGTIQSTQTLIAGNKAVLKRVNGVFSFYEFDGTNMTLLHTSTAANNNAMNIFYDAQRAGGVKDIKLIYNF